MRIRFEETIFWIEICMIKGRVIGFLSINTNIMFPQRHTRLIREFLMKSTFVKAGTFMTKLSFHSRLWVNIFLISSRYFTIRVLSPCLHMSPNSSTESQILRTEQILLYSRDDTLAFLDRSHLLLFVICQGRRLEKNVRKDKAITLAFARLGNLGTRVAAAAAQF